MNNSVGFWSFLALSILVLSLTSAAFATDAYNGKWKIDAARSSWSNGKFPEGMSLEIDLEITADQIKYHSLNDTDKSKPATFDYTAKLDWKPTPLAGSVRYDRVAVRRVGKNEFEIIEMKDGDVIVGAVYEMLQGGRRFVRRGVAKSPDGSCHEYEEFFDKK